ncbi:aminopeptidase P N-terminal domain-containing protein [Mucilaginibacter sp.]|jgi:Xaa-Pro aminopeptidase|uniref:aminopeptidase P N-terminal domain-containing protein n=1 Tax=Mucilaginibacter sp. TaxID=1882438 RepID=UPI002CBB1F55|nr:aminopeptidase P N-terminal domain-containing protein [Mucilaginibacter sp.]HTI59556.1 aminopeptidase P N-terminal domain-containing protein [Mucilaginibacter sp.]
MKYLPISNTLFILNRKNFVKRTKQNSIAIFHANDEFPKNGDQNFPFKQNADFFYLSGIDQEQSILVLYPDCPNPLYKEVLFLRQTDEHIAVWEGHKYTKDEARRASGIENVYWLNEFDTILHSIINYAENVYINTNENDRYGHTVPYRDVRMYEQLRQKYPLHNYERSAVILRDLRVVKSDIEIELTRKACQITRDAFVRVLKFIKPGVTEYEVEAELTHEFLRQRATGNAYSPIIASGVNANVLHYIDNNQVCSTGDILLMDFGAEYANYNADMTRSVPVNGRFTKRQRDVYNAVLRVMKGAIQLIKSGTLMSEYQDEVGKMMTSELIGLKLLNKHEVEKQDTKMPLYKKYFMHGTSHHLGLDVHDFASRYKPFEVGNILTCEPGIYIPGEGVGIRLENDILITTDGNVDLMADIPLEVDHIEEIMNS